jgi:hypothetical protein
VTSDRGVALSHAFAAASGWASVCSGIFGIDGPGAALSFSATDGVYFVDNVRYEPQDPSLVPPRPPPQQKKPWPFDCSSGDPTALSLVVLLVSLRVCKRCGRKMREPAGLAAVVAAQIADAGEGERANEG